MASFAKVGKRYQCGEKSNKIDLRVKIKHNSKLKEHMMATKLKETE